MPDSKGKNSIVGQVVVAVVIALLVGGTAPWWWKEIFPDQTPPSPQPPQVSTQPNPASNGQPVTTLPPSEDEPGKQPLTGCVVKVESPFVSLHTEPDLRSREIITVEPGDYTPLDYEVVDWAGQEQVWFQIVAVGRTGWIMYTTITASINEACP